MVEGEGLKGAGETVDERGQSEKREGGRIQEVPSRRGDAV
jgi:hypothetical protein